MSKSLKRWYSHKKSNSRVRGIKFLLTLEDVSRLMKEAGITHEDTGSRKGKYVLARKNEITGEVDTGAYEIGNCRFIRWEDNIEESNVREVHSEKQKARMEDGTHPFLDKEIQRRQVESNRKRVEDGTHHLLDVPPWDNNTVLRNPPQVKLWEMMPDVHKLWEELGRVGHKKLSRAILEKYELKCNCASMIYIFKDEQKYNKLLEEWILKYEIK
jgi:hypothetical protein